jgi:hypothetical protein
MTCRIDRLAGENSRVVLRVSGRLHAENVDTLRDLLGQEEGAVAIDLEEVSLADHEAVRLLAICETNGTELRNCPAYIREWVSRERAHKSTDLADLDVGTSDDIEDV